MRFSQRHLRRIKKAIALLPSKLDEPQQDDAQVTDKGEDSNDSLSLRKLAASQSRNSFLQEQLAQQEEQINQLLKQSETAQEESQAAQERLEAVQERLCDGTAHRERRGLQTYGLPMNKKTKLERGKGEEEEIAVLSSRVPIAL